MPAPTALSRTPVTVDLTHEAAQALNQSVTAVPEVLGEPLASPTFPSKAGGKAGVEGEGAAGTLPCDPAVMDEALERARGLLADGLGLPPVVFRGMRVCDVGPSIGERALAIAQWGAQVRIRTEPGPGDAPPTERFDFVNGERVPLAPGDTAERLKGLRGLLVPGGLLHLAFRPVRGQFVNALVRGLIAGLCANRSLTPLEAARTLMMVKWEGYGSARVFDAWVRSHITSASVRLDRCLDPVALLREAADLGLDFHAGTPSYRDPLNAPDGPFLRPVTRDLDGVQDILDRAAFGHALGCPIYYAGQGEGAGEMAVLIDEVIRRADACLEGADKSRLEDVAQSLEALLVVARSATMWLGHLGGSGAAAFVSGMAQAYAHLAEDRPQEVIDYARSDQAFRRLWGTPVHHLLLRRSG